MSKSEITYAKSNENLPDKSNEMNNDKSNEGHAKSNEIIYAKSNEFTTTSPVSLQQVQPQRKS
eukprot:7572028-Karenia_brevis.AAC.1